MTIPPGNVMTSTLLLATIPGLWHGHINTEDLTMLCTACFGHRAHGPIVCDHCHGMGVEPDPIPQITQWGRDEREAPELNLPLAA